MADGERFSITDKPITPLQLPDTLREAEEYKVSGNHRLVLLGEIALVLAAAAIIILPKG